MKQHAFDLDFFLDVSSCLSLPLPLVGLNPPLIFYFLFLSSLLSFVLDFEEATTELSLAIIIKSTSLSTTMLTKDMLITFCSLNFACV